MIYLSALKLNIITARFYKRRPLREQVRLKTIKTEYNTNIINRVNYPRIYS